MLAAEPAAHRAQQGTVLSAEEISIFSELVGTG
jgi:hypothetical protein